MPPIGTEATANPSHEKNKEKEYRGKYEKNVSFPKSNRPCQQTIQSADSPEVIAL